MPNENYDELLDELINPTNEDKGAEENKGEQTPPQNIKTPEDKEREQEVYKSVFESDRQGTQVENPRVTERYDRLKHREESNIPQDRGVTHTQPMQRAPQDYRQAQSFENDPEVLEANKYLSEIDRKIAYYEESIKSADLRRPIRPQGFNYSEAMNDPESASAKYLNDKEIYEENRDSLNSLKEEYNGLVSDRQALVGGIQQKYDMYQRANSDRQANIIRELAGEVKKRFNASDDVVRDFINTMGSKQQLTIDELWMIYSNARGLPNANPQNNNMGRVPSPEFNRVRQAQQVPNPMGVLPSQHNNDSRTPEDIILNGMKDIGGNGEIKY